MSEHMILGFLSIATVLIVAGTFAYLVFDGRRGIEFLNAKYLLFGEAMRRDRVETRTMMKQIHRETQTTLDRMDAESSRRGRRDRRDLLVIRAQNRRSLEILRESKVMALESKAMALQSQAMARDSEILVRMMLERLDRNGGKPPEPGTQGKP